MPYSAEVDKVLIYNDFFIDHKRRNTHKMDRPHVHDGYEIHFTLNDNTRYYIEDKYYVGNSGSVAVMNSQEIHRIEIDKDVMYESYYILFKPQLLEFIIPEWPEMFNLFIKRSTYFNNVVQLDLINKAYFTNLLEEIIYLYKNNKVPYQQFKIKHKLIEILLFLNKYFYCNDKYESTVENHSVEELEEITEYIKYHYNEELTLDALANKFFISKATITRLFKQTMGVTPIKYIKYVRFVESRKLLRTGLQIKVVSEKVGYKNDSAFIKMFKNFSGLSPKQYILKNKKGNS